MQHQRTPKVMPMSHPGRTPIWFGKTTGGLQISKAHGTGNSKGSFSQGPRPLFPEVRRPLNSRNRCPSPWGQPQCSPNALTDCIPLPLCDQLHYLLFQHIPHTGWQVSADISTLRQWTGAKNNPSSKHHVKNEGSSRLQPHFAHWRRQGTVFKDWCLRKKKKHQLPGK